MNDYVTIIIGILIPFVGTTLGALTVIFLKGEMKPHTQNALLGFASGVMIAASVWSLLIPAIDMAAEQGKLAWLPACVGFLLGIGFLLLLDNVIPHLHLDEEKPEGIPSKLNKTSMLILAVTLHNIPEGMAVGVVFAGIGNVSSGISLAGAFALSIGIALQNLPEGAIISLPLRSEGMSQKRSLSYGILSGVVEPIAAAITILLVNMITAVLPYILAFAAGAMIYVVVEELIPESQIGEHSDIGTIGVAIGFVLMMVLDVALG
ncbi:ZIP family metal transporter [Mahella sp.]|uniref:ZIP family metal transporter n=1 Tax=Mahella sp. TaxID=2798721 RepID=UPI0025BD9BDF|nr:ZIP family metal transporter [Mahella sp.]MBZ4665194.1 zinc/iron permease [Mahella sp.]